MSAVLDALHAAPTFSEARVQRQALAELHKQERHELNDAFKVACIEAYREAFPKRRKLPENAGQVADAKGGREIYDRILPEFKARAKEMFDRQETEREAADERMRELAKEHPIADTRDTLWSLVDSVSTSTYSTQTASKHYAQRAADRRADDFADRGLATKVVYRKLYSGRGQFGHTYEGGDFLVWAGTDHETAHAIRILGPAVDLVEMVRRCWARQVNPRVYWPFLPHGFEEKHGIDWQGRMTR